MATKKNQVIVTSRGSFMSRSFLLSVFTISGSIFLSWYLKDVTPFTVVAPATVAAWFGGKFAQGLANKE